MISKLSDLVEMANEQPDPQRWLFLFAEVSSESKKNKSQQKGTITPVMCVDKLPSDINAFDDLVKEADEQILNALSQGNKDYEDKFGFIFIVCATGKSAEQMSQLLQTRLPNTYEQELTNAAQEQRKIFQIRIDKALAASE